jgi:hypothetical protein
MGPSNRPGAEISRWIGIIATALGAISAIFVMLYYPVWSLIYIAIAIMMIYGLAHPLLGPLELIAGKGPDGTSRSRCSARTRRTWRACSARLRPRPIQRTGSATM